MIEILEYKIGLVLGFGVGLSLASWYWTKRMQKSRDIVQSTQEPNTQNKPTDTQSM